MPDDIATLTTERLKAWSDGLVQVLDNISGASAPVRMCAAIGEIVPIDFSSVFVLRRNSAPIQILDDLPKGSETVAYVEGPYLLDPVYDSFLKGTLPACGRLEDICPDDFFESDYFLKYWRDINIVSEFCINTHCDDDTVVHFSLSRVAGSQAFSATEIELMTAIGAVVISTMQKFWQESEASYVGSGADADSFHEHLKFVLDNFGTSILTAREIDVMQLTMRGYSDKLSARELDISPGTVRNHKKSIFSKLQVSSQGQVFGLFLDVLQLPASGDIGPDPLATLLEQRAQAASI
jgi:DNA-binding CsgD family transcriptional regulator